MTGTLLAMPVLRAVDSGGVPISGALLQFYLTGSTTPAMVYTSASLSTPFANPVVADSGGLFAPIYLDPSVTYRAQLQSAGGMVIRDVDPLSITTTEATLAQVNAGVATGVFVSPAKLAAWSGVPAALGYTPVNRAGDTVTNLMIANSTLAPTSAGYLGAPVNEQDGSYSFALGDAGKMVRGSPSGPIAYTIPPDSAVAFPLGTVIVVRNVGAGGGPGSGGTISLVRGSGVNLWIAGSGTSQNVSVAQWGLASMVHESANGWVVSGVGIS